MPPDPAVAVAAPDPKKPLGPARERAVRLREAADLLDKAAEARDRDARSFAEQLFSSAELIVGPGAVADVAPLFREGAPPRVDAPTKVMPKDAAPQPAAVGNSDHDQPPPPKPPKGAIAGTLTLDGKPFAGDFGVVTLTHADGKARPIPTARVMEQRNRTFAPHVLVVPVGSVVAFPNFDPVFHNVFSTSEAKPFDLGLYKNGEAREVLFDREGTVRVGCNLHSNMAAYIVVVAARHYAVTDGSGGFAFGSLEPGKYTLRAYSEKSLAPVTREVVVKPGKNRVELSVTGDAPAGPLPDKFGVARVAKKP
jgi:plastocyanin